MYVSVMPSAGLGSFHSLAQLILPIALEGKRDHACLVREKMAALRKA